MPEMNPSTTCWARRSSREILAIGLRVEETARIVSGGCHGCDLGRVSTTDYTNRTDERTGLLSSFVRFVRFVVPR